MKKILLLLLLAANVTHAQFIGAPRRGLSGSGGGGGSETDPVFSVSPAAGITSPNITNWLSAYSWGNHASAGYQITSNLSTDLTASASKYPSVNAVNTGLGLKANLAGGASFMGTIGLPSTTSIGTVSATEISYLDGVTTSIQPNIDARAPSNSPTFTGTPLAPTATAGTSTTQIATTAFVTGAANLKANLASPTFTGTVVLPSTTSIGGITNTELSYVDGVTSGIQAQIDSKPAANNGTLTGITTTGSFLPSANGTESLGSASMRYLNGYFGRINAGGTLTLISASSNAIQFSNSSTTAGLFAQFAPTTNELMLQAPGTSFGTNTGERLQVGGTAKITGATNVGGDLTLGADLVLSNLPALGTKPAKVLVDNSGEVSSRSLEQFREDLFDPLSERRIAYAEAQGNSTAMNSLGLGVTALGTATNRPVTYHASNFNGRQRKLGYVGATSANSSAGISCQGQFAVYYGFIFKARFSIQAYDAGHRYICGIGETTTNTVEPSTLLNRVHLYADAGDVNWKLVSADASTVGTPIDLGANFPVNTSATDVYDVTFEVAPNGSTIKYTVKRLGTGFTASGTISSNLPASSALLSPQVFASNAATGTAASINIMRVNMITDY